MSNGDRDHRTARLTAAAAARTTSATARARRAITRLHNTGQPVTFVAVARAADVSTSFLYKQTQLRQDIDAKRGTATAGIERSRAASAESLRTKLATAIDRNRELTEQLEQLHTENEALRSRLLELGTRPPAKQEARRGEHADNPSATGPQQPR
ncbi:MULTISPECIES: DUF6262 family protein [Tsukamurella]|uniref:DUF6262 family protein n=1 Tax=Tsukamurella strandjordii TaxID=147577 RepID=A0AA90ST54_9ACTN|nr:MULTISPECIES: DUF6262 family protein [Tsukamurella]MDP0400536.1 DUF6262 family protein [Tsukamurella strandjordii]MEC4613875.1 DUF6262 family protein [Tsukamurella tyrosinosolvens]WEL93361.1 DUF6262 family protein [Tsukamurella tyrosinosolvens]